MLRLVIKNCLKKIVLILMSGPQAILRTPVPDLVLETTVPGVCVSGLAGH